MTQEPSVCRFCLESKETLKNPLLQPCECRGSIRLVHEKCLNRWRQINPLRNSVICLLCFTPYKDTVDQMMEILPDETKFVVLLVRCPILLFFLVNYIGILHFSMLFYHFDREDFFEIYQHLFQALYFCFFASLWRVKDKKSYWRAWRDWPAVCMFASHGISTYLVCSHQYAALIPLNVSLTYYWHRHKQILRELNQR